MKLLSGRKLAHAILSQVKNEIKTLPVVPGLGIILIGDNPASKLYVSLKTREAENLGVYVRNIKLPESASFEEAAAAIKNLNGDSSVHGILLQLPLPSHLDTSSLIALIRPEKDVDGFLSSSFVSSPTIRAIQDTLRMIPFSLKGLKGCLLVKSEVFREKIAEMAEEEGVDVVDNVKEADIVIIAKGIPECLRADMVKEGVIVIDVGINMINGKAVGDSDPDIAKKAAFLTPVPGGVGPLTIVHIFENLVLLTKKVL